MLYFIHKYILLYDIYFIIYYKKILNILDSYNSKIIKLMLRA